MAAAVLLAYWALLKMGKRTGFSENNVSAMLTIIMLAAVAGARAGYVWEHWAEFSQKPLEIFMLQHGGLMFYGGLIGAWIAVTGYALVTHRSVMQVYDISVSALPLGHAIGRLGCFFNGCCYGRVSDCFLAVTFPRGSFPWESQLSRGLIDYSARRSLPVLPSQLFEAVLDLILFAVLFRSYGRPGRRAGMQVAVYALSYSAIRFIVEMTRDDERFHIGSISIGQLISLGIFAFGAAVLVFVLCRRPSRTY